MSDRYGTVVIDPPWDFGNPGEFVAGETPVKRGAGSKERYGSMTLPEIYNLPVHDLAEKDAHIYLWCPSAFVSVAETMLHRWGFRPIALCVWMKSTEEPVVCRGCREYAKAMDIPLEEVSTSLETGTVRASARTGYYYRHAVEFCWFGVRGKCPPGTRDVLPTAWLWPRTPHSVKHEAFYDMVEQMSPGPYLEMFARRNRLNWETYGNEALEHVVLGEGNVVELKAQG